MHPHAISFILLFKYNQLRIQAFSNIFPFELVLNLLMREYQQPDVKRGAHRLVIK